MLFPALLLVLDLTGCLPQYERGGSARLAWLGERREQARWGSLCRLIGAGVVIRARHGLHCASPLAFGCLPECRPR